MISMIAAIGKNNELGKNNNLIWHFKEDMKYFKDTTMGHTVVMGRKTYESLPGTLSGREMIVISTKTISGVKTYNNIDKVVCKYKDSDEEVFICGGASIYREFLPYANRLYLTEIDSVDKDADTYFPEFNRREWKRKLLAKYEQKGITFSMYLYERRIM